MVAQVVVVAEESSDGRLEIGGQLLGDLVCVPLRRLVVSLQPAVGPRMEGRCQGVLDADHSQVVPESSSAIARTVVTHGLVRSVTSQS